MTAPTFTEVLDAYCHAIACGAESIIKADRFADLTRAHTEHVAREYAIEQMIADPEGQQLVADIHARKAQA